MSFPGSRKRSQSGFSLMEIIVVLVLLAAVALLVAPAFTRGLESLELRTATRDMITRMKQFRTKAIAVQEVQRVFIGRDDNDKPYYAWANEYEEIQNTYELPEDTEIVLEDGMELPLHISFYPNGRSSGAFFALRTGRNRLYMISVDPVTGFGRVVKPDEDPPGQLSY
ncbi:MAG TPA: prepilin-type N-terminal cleavage/methylation domain-containing protein [Acidobacteriota bacterium]|nr:prepilin-type N-terminal cleavage/methylation domain-containing protein [Acidobacteriota bacterium]